MKKKYQVYATVVGSKYVGEVMAHSEQEAKEIMWNSDKLDISLCHECVSECEVAEITSLSVEEES